MINEMIGQITKKTNKTRGFILAHLDKMSLPAKFHLYGSRVMAIFANIFHCFHKLATHRAIIGHTPKVDLELKLHRVVRSLTHA